jgi:hypothetical protein
MIYNLLLIEYEIDRKHFFEKISGTEPPSEMGAPAQSRTPESNALGGMQKTGLLAVR